MLTCRAFINGRAKHVFAVVITSKGIKILTNIINPKITHLFQMENKP